MKKVLIGIALLAACATSAAAAQAAPNNNSSEKLRQAVTLAGVRTHQANFQTIADAAGGNRFAGTAGHEQSAQYVYDRLAEAGYSPWFQEFEYDAFFERTPSQLYRTNGTPTTYVNGVDFRVLSYSGSGDVSAPLALPSGDARGCFASDYSATAVAGKIALVQRGTPAGFSTDGSVCTFRLKLDLAKAAGAIGIIVYNNVDGVVNGTLGATGLSTIPGVGMTKALGEALRAEIVGGGTPAFRIVTNTAQEQLTTRNVLAETDGGDPSNVVMVGAHLDSVTAGPGINDNGSGSAAILETAIQMAKVKPRNKVRFAWWSAEESGLIGSTYYVAHLDQAQRDAIALYLNFDMIGSPNFARFVYDGDNSTATGSVGPAGSDVIERVFYGYFESVNLPAEPTPFNGRSDYGPFIAAGVGIPAGGLFTGAENPKTAEQVLKYGGTAGLAYDPCYHAACDTFANNNDEALDTNSDAVAHATITFAQSTELINGVRGKGNFKRPQIGANDGAGTGPGGGGGSHDHEGEAS